MKTVDTATGTVWLDVPEFARKQQKARTTIYEWCASGFVVELGYVIRKDVTGHWRIGIPPEHSAYSQFA